MQCGRKSEVFILIAFICVAIGLIVFWVEPLGIFSLLERLTPNVVYRVRTDRPLVGLSFDDGPHPVFTPQVLEILQNNDAKATFFLIGERALRYPMCGFSETSSGYRTCVVSALVWPRRENA